MSKAYHVFVSSRVILPYSLHIILYLTFIPIVEYIYKTLLIGLIGGCIFSASSNEYH